MATRNEEFMASVAEHFGEIDELVLVVVKGHLLLEEKFVSFRQACVRPSSRA